MVKEYYMEGVMSNIYFDSLKQALLECAMNNYIITSNKLDYVRVLKRGTDLKLSSKAGYFPFSEF